MWAHKPWVGRFLSPGARGSELAEYARWCNSVEGNTTFYAVPPATSVARWAEQAPPDFRFAFKVPRTVTHDLRLRGAADVALAEFLRAIEPLGPRIGPVQLQLPPSFGPESIAALAAFVGRLPADVAWVTELRHPAFFDGRAAHRAVDEILGGAGVGRVVLDTRPLYSAPPRSAAAVEERRTKPRLPVVTDAVGDRPVVRVIGPDDAEAAFTGLLAWVPQLVAWIRDGREPSVFVHQPENVESPSLARRLHAAVAAEVGGLVALPEPLPVAPPGEVTGQDSLF